MNVLIIGAGISGLAAAQYLSAAGAGVRIVEARGRIGGRIHTVPDPASSMPVELGAEFVHGKPAALLRLAREAGLTLFEMSGQSLYSENGRLIERCELFPQIDQILARLSDPNLSDQTFAEFLRRFDSDPQAKMWATAYVEGFNAARADRISIRALS